MCLHAHPSTTDIYTHYRPATDPAERLTAAFRAETAPQHRKVARRRERKQMDREEREAAELPAPGGTAELPAPEPESAP